MAKEAIISTSALNCYGSRVLTPGIDWQMYLKNPVLLWMHQRAFEGGAMPIGRMENLRVEGDRLIGTPVFDPCDELARKIEGKWENGFLRMVSAGLRIVETSEDPALLLPGQTRATITRCRLEEVSIVDIGANDEALQLYAADGGRIALAAGTDHAALPLLQNQVDTPAAGQPAAPINKPNNHTDMNKEFLQLLGLPDTATEQEALGALRLLKEQADKADSLVLASIETLVDGAVAERRITADKKAHFVNIGRTAGLEALRSTLELMCPQPKPTDLIRPASGHVPGGNQQTFAKLSDVPAADIPALKESDPAEYARLYKAEYGMEMKDLKTV